MKKFSIFNFSSRACLSGRQGRLASGWQFSNHRSGLTLIEILVAMAIFATASGIIIDLTLNMMKAEEIAASNQIALDNARFIMQRIAKAIRVSVIKTPSGDNLTILKLDHPRRGIVEYTFSSGRIIEELGYDSNTDSFLDSSNVVIQNFSFDIKGADSGIDDLQPQVTLVMKVKPPKVKNKDLPSINIQTTLSQRCLDISSACRAQ